MAVKNKTVKDGYGDEMKLSFFSHTKGVIITPPKGTYDFLFDRSNVQVLKDMVAFIEGGED